MEIVAKHRYMRISSQKVRLVVDMIRNKKAKEALEILHFSDKKAAFLVKKVLKSAIANAKHNANIAIDNLIITKIFVDVGPSIKRSILRAKGRSDRILKRTSHVTVILSND